MSKKLTEIEIEEVSLVDKAANTGSTVAFQKTADDRVGIFKAMLRDTITKCENPNVPGQVTMESISAMAKAGACRYHLQELLDRKLFDILKRDPAMTKGDAWQRLFASDSEARHLREIGKRLPGPAVRPVRPVGRVDLRKISPAFDQIQSAAEGIRKANPNLSIEAARARFMETAEGAALRQRYSEEVRAYWRS